MSAEGRLRALRFRLQFPWVLAIVLPLLALVLLDGLAGPPMEGPGYVHDECYQAFTAHRYAMGDPDAWGYGDRATLEKLTRDDLTGATTYEWVHPPLAKLIMSWFIGAFGFSPTVWRLGSVLMGLLTAAGVMAVAAHLYTPRIAFITGALLTLEGLFVSMSRIAMNDIYVAAPCAWLVYASARAATSKRSVEAWTLVAGVFAGLAIAVKWNAAPLCIFGGLLCLGALWSAPVGRVRALGVWILAFAIVPAGVYLLSYAPYFALGHDLRDLAGLTQQIIDFHKSLRAGHSSSSHWYEWPLAIRPVWLYQGDGPTPTEVRNMYLFPNPLIFVAMFPAVIAAAVRTVRQRASHELFVWVPFLAAWLPWSVVGRVTFIQYLMPGLAFGMVALAVELERLARRGPRWTLAVRVYGVLVFLTFMNLYPLLTGQVEPRSHVASPRWFWLPIWRPCSGSCASLDPAERDLFQVNGEGIRVVHRSRIGVA